MSSAASMESGLKAKSPDESTSLLGGHRLTPRGSIDTRHELIAQLATDIDLAAVTFDPALLYKGSPRTSERRLRSKARAHSTLGKVHDTTHIGTLEFLWNAKLRNATVFDCAKRPVMTTALNLVIAYGVGGIYLGLSPVVISADIMLVIKEFIDLCITGIIFLLSGFVVTMLTRWWAMRTQCVGALHGAIANLATISAAMWPTSSASDREARAINARYGLLAYKMLYLEARAADEEDESVELDDRLPELVSGGLLTQEEAAALAGLPAKSAAVLGWLAAFWERVFDKESGLVASQFFRTADNGRYSVVFGQLFAARQSVSLTYSYLNTQIPFGYLHLLLVVTSVTAFANSFYCGVSLGSTLKDLNSKHAGAETYLPYLFVRTLRILFVPMLLDGLMVIGTVIAMPLGNDLDDYPAGTFFENLEDECATVGAAVESCSHPTSKMIKAEKTE